MLRRLIQPLLRIPRAEVTFEQRGFYTGNWAVQSHLERAGNAFLDGYHAALETPMPSRLPRLLDNDVESEFQGFAYEGASMCLTLLDALLPGRSQRLPRFLAGPGSAHVYMGHVGVGWALARLRRRVERPLQRLDPLLRWLAVDGYGFHEGYFHWPRTVGDHHVPRHLSGYAQRAFDQGLGRSLWFVEGADVERIFRTIASFPRSRHADLWSGVGLACAYAGGVERTDVETLRNLAESHTLQLAQGAAFAAEARERAGNLTPHTERACQVLCEISAPAAAKVTRDTAADLVEDPDESAIEMIGNPPYECWRQRIQAQLAQEVTVS